MKTVKYILYIYIISIGFTSCNFLDKEPTYLSPETYFKNESQAFSFLTGIYAILQQTPYYGNSWLYLVGGDDLSHYGGPRGPGKSGLICNNANAGNVEVATQWYNLYAGINRSNMFIESIDKTPGMSDEVRECYKSEARFLRAYYYYILVSGWGDVPFKTQSTQTVENLSIPRTDKHVIYDFICTEIEQCADALLSARELNYLPGRISKSTAWGILARIYLFRAGEFNENNRDHVPVDQEKVQLYFKKANEFAKKVKFEGHDLVEDYWQIFIDLAQDKYNSTGKMESIWEVEFGGNGTEAIKTSGRTGNNIGLIGPDLSGSTFTGKQNPGYSYGFIYATPKLYKLYEKNGDTERMDWNIAPFQYKSSKDKGVYGREFEYGKKGTLKYPCYEYGENDIEKTEEESAKDLGRNCAKYRREYEPEDKGRNETRINIPMLRYSDVLLMIAETENELNSEPTQEAYECINRVRERAGIAELSDLTKEEFRQAVKDERAMELCFEFYRKFDLIRWGEFIENMHEMAELALSGEEWAQGPKIYSYFEIPSSYNYFPIPTTEMAVNKEITKNNPGW